MAKHVNVQPCGQDRYRLWASAGSQEGRRQRRSKMFYGRLTDAVKEQRRWQTEIDAGGHRGPRDRTVSHALDSYLRLAKSLRWTAATINKNEMIVRLHLRPKLGAVRLADLDPAMITAAFTVDSHGAATVRSWATVLRAALEYQVRPRGPLMFNPALYAVIPAGRNRKPVVPTAGTVGKALDQAKRDNPDFYAFLRLVAAAGNRRGEACAVRRNHLDLSTGRLLLETGLSSGGKGVGLVDEGRTKTGRDRVTVLGADTLGVLAAYDRRKQDAARMAAVTRPDDSYLFSPRLDGSVPYWPSSMSRQMRMVADKAGVALTLQGLRRFVTSSLLDQGFAPSAVQQRQGHGAQVMMRHYAALVDDTARRAGDVIDELLTG